MIFALLAESDDALKLALSWSLDSPAHTFAEVGRPAPACHPRARPLRGGRLARRASPFPDSSPPPGERIKEGTNRQDR